MKCQYTSIKKKLKENQTKHPYMNISTSEIYTASENKITQTVKKNDVTLFY